MTADPSPSSFPSLPPTFGWRRVVELADEFGVSSADMLAICDRLGVEAADASQWLDAATVDRIRDVVSVKGPGALLKPETPAKPEKAKVEKPPKLASVKPSKPVKPPRAKAPGLPKPPKPPKLKLVAAPAPALTDAA